MYLETIVQEFSDVVDNSIEPLLKAPSHCVKNVRIRSNSGPYFPAFGLNTERYSVSLRILLKNYWTHLFSKARQTRAEVVAIHIFYVD